MLVANLLSATAHTLAIDELEVSGLAIRSSTSIGQLVSTTSARIDHLIMNRDPVTDGALRQTRGMCTPHRKHTNHFRVVRGRPSSHGHAVESAYSRLCAGSSHVTRTFASHAAFLLRWTVNRRLPPVAPPRQARHSIVSYVCHGGRALGGHQRRARLRLAPLPSRSALSTTQGR